MTQGETRQVWLALGANLGNRPKTLRAAVDLLGQRLHITAVSHWLETAPVGGPAGQGAYLNGALGAQTDLSAQELLAFCLATEARLGRIRNSGRIRWDARPIDIDLLLYGDAVIDLPPELIVPHPQMWRRTFVLQPLCEIAPDLPHPVLHKTIRELSAQAD